MKEVETKFDINNIHSVEFNLLDGQVEIVLSSQAEQVETKRNNIDKLSNIGKMLIKDTTNINTERKLSII